MEAAANIRTDIQNLVAKYGGDVSNIAKEMKRLHSADSKISKLETGMDKLIADYGTISLARFKKEAAKAWKRAYPDGLEKRELKGYQLFVKETMPTVKTANPDKTHAERMAIIGKMWQESKGAPAPAEANAEAMEVENADADTGNKRMRPDSPKCRVTRSRKHKG